VHFTAGPVGTQKYVHCPAGRVLDVVVDLRVGSPAFGRFDTAVLDEYDARALYLPAGVGHAFAALEDGSVMSYLLSQGYDAPRELAVSVLDPALGLPLPAGVEPVLSERDRVAPTLAEALAAGVLPRWGTDDEEEGMRR
jgi:epimerase EvaD